MEPSKKSFFCPEKVFLLFAALFGTIILLITPPFQVPDEYLHFDYAYAISQGKIYVTTGEIPESIQTLADSTRSLPFHPEAKISYSSILQFTRIPLDPDKTTTVAFHATAKYTPIPYIATAASIVIGRALGFNPVVLFYMGRVFNLILWIFLCFHAIKLIPDQKWAYLLLILTPMSLFEAGSYASDSFLNAIAFFWIGLCFFLASDAQANISIKQEILVLVTASLLALTKPPYIFLVGLFFLIPKGKFGSNLHFRKFTLLFTGLSLIFFAVSILYLLNDGSAGSDWTSYSISSQLNYLFSNPLELLLIILRSIKHLIIPYWYSSIGLLGWIDTLLPEYIYITYPIMMILFSLFNQQKDIKFPIKGKLLIALLGLAVMFTIFFSLYLTWTPIGQKTIDGFQGRYLVPLFLLLPPLFKNRWTTVQSKWLPVTICGFVFLVLSLSVRAIVLRYYIL